MKCVNENNTLSKNFPENRDFFSHNFSQLQVLIFKKCYVFDHLKIKNLISIDILCIFYLNFFMRIMDYCYSFLSQDFFSSLMDFFHLNFPYSVIYKTKPNSVTGA